MAQHRDPTYAELKEAVAEAGRQEASRQTERLITFADAVVAIALTLLALELPVPEGLKDGAANSELWHELGKYGIDYRSFLISFVVIWAYWGSHRQLFRDVTGINRRLGQLTGLWLLLIVITPFATKILAGDGADEARFGFYAGVQALIGIVMLVTTLYIRHARLHSDATSAEHYTRQAFTFGAVALAFAVSIPVVFLTHWAYLCWVAAPLVRLAALRARPRPVAAESNSSASSVV